MSITTSTTRRRLIGDFCPLVCAALAGAAVFLTVQPPEAQARNPYRRNFFDAYPSATGSILDDAPSNNGHCGLCHFEFEGGGPRNPYGLAVEATDRSEAAILGLGPQDSDGDGFSNDIEITDTITFVNTPTFPGLTPTNEGSTSGVDISDIHDHLVPSTGGDTTPPAVTVLFPNGGELFTGNGTTTVTWSASDASGIAGIDIYVSLDNGSSYRTLAVGLSNTGAWTWHPANRPTTEALIKVEATDNAFNEGEDVSDGTFTIVSPPGGIVPSTLRDFDMPGTQPFEAGILNPPTACSPCHGNYDQNVEPYYNWRGSMMSVASYDPLFLANMVIANQDAPDSGDLCLRCHLPRGWLQGRSVPTDGSAMLDSDKFGVTCDLCHRLLDPIYEPGASPPEDLDILDDLEMPTTEFGNGMYTVDPTGARRGPFVNAASGHPILVSPFHREAALCGICHDVSNPAFETDGNGNYVPNTFDEMSPNFSAHSMAPVERTYSEWFYSDYNTPGGIFAPEFGGNLDFVSTCQDCHMRDVTGQGCNLDPPIRPDLPLHDMTGGSTWMPGIIASMYPAETDAAALQDGVLRARYMLQNAAELDATQDVDELKVTVTNNTGHKLPTGYPEGRRMWINVKYFDDSLNLVGESAHYDVVTGELGHDAEAKIYHIEPGVDATVAPLLGVAPGPTFHFVLNNAVFLDNRIPPRGFTNANFDQFGGAHVGYSYADGQYWDDTYYGIPAGATSAEVNLYYQSTSKEFVEFLRDENTTDSQGQDLYDTWEDTGKCPPELMATVTVPVTGPPLECAGNTNGDNQVDTDDFLAVLAGWGACPDPCPPSCDADVAGDDCQVNTDDFLAVLGNWGPCPAP